jgi:hypothetical protein
MLNEIPLDRAPENKRTGIEISPKVKCPDQTDDGIVPSLENFVSRDRTDIPLPASFGRARLQSCR